ncbi:MAG: phytanoyl-CoA dioxygenase family protein [Candidatus Sericytochromatia bacterium]
MDIGYSKEFTDIIEKKGIFIFEQKISSDFIDKINEELEISYHKRQTILKNNNVEGNNIGTSHHLIVDKGSFLELLEKIDIYDYFKLYFNGNFILNSYGAVINEKNTSAYVQNIHRDVKVFSSDLNIMLNLLVTLDNFTLENGATYLLEGSHKIKNKPEEKYFFDNSYRAVLPKGSLIVWNSNIWHSTAPNTTDKPRKCLTLTFTKPYIKQQLDYCRALGENFVENLSDNLKQILGYNSRVPSSLEEYYQPIEKRFYKNNQY